MLHIFKVHDVTAVGLKKAGINSKLKRDIIKGVAHLNLFAVS